MIVTVDEVKTHLRIQYDEEDDFLTGLIAQAQVAACLLYTSRCV